MAVHTFDYPGAMATVHGTITVEYPDATAKVVVKVPLHDPRTYNLHIKPGHLTDEDTHTFGFVVAVTIVVRASPQTAQVFVTVKVAGFEVATYPFSYVEPKGDYTIKAYGVPIFIKELSQYADHTYAIATDAKTGAAITWKCGGAYENGRLLATGRGDPIPCDCISLRKQDPLLGGLAGIRYGMDGVCHQATNRILYPIGMDVRNANGYQVSVNLYGPLGLNFPDGEGRRIWADLRSRCQVQQAPRDAELPPSAPGDMLAADTAGTIQALELMSDGALTQTQTDGLMAERSSVLAVRDRLSEALHDGSIGGAALAAGINTAVAAYLGTAARIVPHGMFRSLFGTPPGEQLLLVNPHIAEEYYRAGVPERLTTA